MSVVDVQLTPQLYVPKCIRREKFRVASTTIAEELVCVKVPFNISVQLAIFNALDGMYSNINVASSEMVLPSSGEIKVMLFGAVDKVSASVPTSAPDT